MFGRAPLGGRVAVRGAELGERADPLPRAGAAINPNAVADAGPLPAPRLAALGVLDHPTHLVWRTVVKRKVGVVKRRGEDGPETWEIENGRETGSDVRYLLVNG